jgi:hypothetical protein
MSRSRVKTMIIVFFESHGIVHKEFVPPGQTSTSSTKMSWNGFENGPSKSKQTLQMIGCCTIITRHLTLLFQFKNFWKRKTFLYFHILPTAQI